jgi:hypothetical protein
MRTIGFALAFLVVPQVAVAAAPDPAVMAPIHQFVDSLNAGDAKKAGEAFVPNAPIVDEFAPFHWTSFGAWLNDFAADTKKNNVTGVHVTLRPPTTSKVGATDAYEVVPNVITAKSNGKLGHETGIFTFALTKTAAGWRIASWAWAKQ